MKRMALRMASVVALLATMFWAQPAVHGAAKPEAASFDFPGAIRTTASGINPRGDIVGPPTASMAIC